MVRCCSNAVAWLNDNCFCVGAEVGGWKEGGPVAWGFSFLLPLTDQFLLMWQLALIRFVVIARDPLLGHIFLRECL